MKRLMPRRGTKEREDRKATTEEGMKNRTTHTTCGREGWIVVVKCCTVSKDKVNARGYATSS